MRVSPAVVADIEWATLALTGLIAVVSLVSPAAAAAGVGDVLRAGACMRSLAVSR